MSRIDDMQEVPSSAPRPAAPSRLRTQGSCGGEVPAAQAASLQLARPFDPTANADMSAVPWPANCPYGRWCAARLTRASAGSSICCLSRTSTALPHFASRRGVPPLWAIATADARPCTWPRTPMLHLPLARAAYSIGAGRRFARGFDRDSRALPQLVAAACQVGGLGGIARQ